MKLNYKRTLFVGMAFLSIQAFWNVYDAIIPLILKNTFHMGDTLAGFIMALDNILALFLLPVFGALSDRTNTRLGKRTPFIVAGTALAVVFMLLIPTAANLVSLPFFVAALGATLLAMGCYRSPAVALMPDLTPKPLRSKANAVINLMGAVGGIYALGMIRLLIPKGDTPSYLPLFISIAALMALAVGILLITIKEKKLALQLAGQPDEEEDNPSPAKGGARLGPGKLKSLVLILCSIFLWFAGYNAVSSAFSKFAVHYWGMQGGSFADPLLIGTVAAIAAYIPVAFLAGKIGRRKSILMGVAVICAAFAVGALIKSYTPWVNALFAVVGVAWAGINVNSYPMVVEIASGGNTGRYTGYYYIFSMSAQAITPVVSGYFLEHVGYQTLFPYAAIFMALAFATMLFVRHGDSKPLPPKSKLEAFDE